MTTRELKSNPSDVRSHVRERYGKIAEDFSPASGASCCGPSDSGVDCCGPEGTIQLDQIAMIYDTPDVGELPEEVTGLSLGCGDPVTLASLQPGQTVLDLGSGGGIDCFLAAKYVGEKGRVIGVDMTAAMIEKARANKTKLGTENVDFRLGEIEHLPVSDGTVDVVISNCVINLSPDKPQVFREAFRVLQPGGRLAVSDIVTDGPLPEEIKNSLSAWVGCVSGAMEVEDYLAAIESAGFVDVELEPVYMDEEMIDAAVEQLDLGDSVEEGKKAVAVMEGGEAMVIDLNLSNNGGKDPLYKTVFSAKVKARKPLITD